MNTQRIARFAPNVNNHDNIVVHVVDITFCFILLIVFLAVSLTNKS
jgi:hypothetical protein